MSDFLSLLGPAYGLSLVLNVEQYDYMYGDNMDSGVQARHSHIYIIRIF